MIEKRLLKKSIGLVTFVALVSPSVLFSATQIGTTGVYYDNTSAGVVNFYSDAAQITQIGNSDVDESPYACDVDGPGGGQFVLLLDCQQHLLQQPTLQVLV